MRSPRRELLEAAAALRRRLEEWMDAGEVSRITHEAGGDPPAAGPASAPAAAGPAAPPAERLARLAQEAAACRRCPLGASRKQAVFGEGDPRAGLMLVGEAPGAEEDREGKPFVGEAGKLLTRILASIGLERDRVYICNVLKCRPPGNRNPLPEEIRACRSYLQAQVETVAPKLICALGTFAAQTLLDSAEPIGRLRGKVHEFQGVPVVPTFHPAALLYHPQNKRLVWEDMKLIAGKLGLQIAAGSRTPEE